MTGDIAYIVRTSLPVRVIMGFALIYLVFFTLDIFIVCKFDIFGMIPYSALVSAVSLYTVLMMCSLWLRNKTWPQRGMLVAWMIFLLMILLQNLFNATYRIFWIRSISAHQFNSILSKLDQLILFIAVMLFITNFLIKVTDTRLHGWLLFSAGAAIPINAIQIFISPTPVWLYRYGGILGLPMVFGWLMINLSILDIKYGVEYKNLQMSNGRE